MAIDDLPKSSSSEEQSEGSCSGYRHAQPVALAVQKSGNTKKIKIILHHRAAESILGKVSQGEAARPLEVHVKPLASRHAEDAMATIPSGSSLQDAAFSENVQTLTVESRTRDSHKGKQGKKRSPAIISKLEQNRRMVNAFLAASRHECTRPRMTAHLLDAFAQQIGIAASKAQTTRRPVVSSSCPTPFAHPYHDGQRRSSRSAVTSGSAVQMPTSYTAHFTPGLLIAEYGAQILGASSEDGPAMTVEELSFRALVLRNWLWELSAQKARRKNAEMRAGWVLAKLRTVGQLVSGDQDDREGQHDQDNEDNRGRGRAAKTNRQVSVQQGRIAIENRVEALRHRRRMVAFANEVEQQVLCAYRALGEREHGLRVCV